MSNPYPATAWKVLTGEQFVTLESSGSFTGAPVDVADGYIHLSTAGQLAETIDKHFAGQSDLWLVEVDLEALGEAIRWKQSRGGAEFPHLYASLPLSATIAYGPLERHADGTIKPPVAG